MPNLIIGSRGSKLALWQTNWVKNRLEKTHPGLIVEVEIIKTTGDKLTESSLAEIGGKGVFTKEIEEALIDRRIDLAVHSLKDLPTTLPDGIHIAAITEREDVRDALIVRPEMRDRVHSIKELPQGARIGTGSLRRRAQLLHHRPDLQIFELRGNIDTRLRKLSEGGYDAIVLASAGLIRLGLGEHITARLEIDEMLTAVGQGALGIETRIDDQRTNLLLESLNHWPTRHATEAERGLLRELGGGCAVPIAAFGRVRKEKTDGKKIGKLILEALVCDIDGKKMIRQQASGSIHQAEAIGEQLANDLSAAGALELLSSDGNKERPAFAPPYEIKRPAKPAPASNIHPGNLTASMAMPMHDRPLADKRIIVTRSIKQSGELNKALESLGAEIIACPTIEIKEPSSWNQLDRALKHLSWYDWIGFTSVNGVEYFLRRLDELGHGRAELLSHKVCAVGRKTAERLKSENISIDLMPERFTAESLVEEFIKRYGVRQRLRGSRMLLPASKISRDVIRHGLDKVGVYVEVVEAYRTVMPASSLDNVSRLITESKADYIIFTSPSTVANLAALLETDQLAHHLAGTRIVCIGPVTADAARQYGLDPHIQPNQHTGNAIVEAIVADGSPTAASSKGSLR